MPRKPPLDQLVSLLSELFCQMFKDLCSLTLLSPSFKLLTTCYPVNTLKRLMESTRHIRNVKIHHVWADREFLCLLWQNCRRPWSFTCEPCSSDSGRTGFVWVRSKVPPNARCVTSYDFSTHKVNVQRKFTNRLLLFVVTLWIGKMWRSGAVNSPK